MAWLGVGLIVIAGAVFILLRPKHGVSKLGNRPFLETIVAAMITGLAAIGIVMTVAGVVSG